MNEDRFTGKAENYAKYRPEYAEGLIDYLYKDTGFGSNSKIADIGSGTGILSGMLLKRGSTVYLVEPNKDMSEQAKKNLAGYDNCIHISASAENTGICDNSVDFITAAQAFHWFDKELFKIECRRILKVGGRVVLVWNCRVETDSLIIENDVVNRKFCCGYKGFTGGNFSDDEYRKFFKAVKYMEFENNLSFDMNGFIGRNLSSSYAPRPEEGNFVYYVSELKQLFGKYEKNGVVIMRNITISYIGEV